MRDQWTRFRIGDVADVFDGPHATPAKTQAGPWFLSISSLANGRLDLSQSAHLSDVDFVKWTRRVRPLEGDTLFSYETRLGESAYWSMDCDAALGRRMGLLRPKPGVYPRFLAYAYLSPQFQDEIRKRAIHGATVDRIPIAELPNWEILLPPLDEQRRIAGVLGALDDLIDVNRGLIRDLQDLSLAQYAEMSSVTTEVRRLGDLASVNAKQTKPKPSGSLTYLDIASVGDGSVDWPAVIDWSTAPSRARRLAGAGSTIWSTVRPNRRAHALLTHVPNDLVVSTGFAVLEPKIIGSAEIFCATNGENFVEYLMSRAEGSAYPAIRGSAFEDALVPYLGRQVSEIFEAAAWPLLRAAGELAEESRQLAFTRDELLPLLMGGRVRVAEEVAA